MHDQVGKLIFQCREYVRLATKNMIEMTEVKITHLSFTMVVCIFKVMEVTNISIQN